MTTCCVPPGSTAPLEGVTLNSWQAPGEALSARGAAPLLGPLPPALTRRQLYTSGIVLVLVSVTSFVYLRWEAAIGAGRWLSG